MKENGIYITSLVFLFFGLVSTICYFALTENSFSLQLSLLIVAIVSSFLTIILLTTLFAKHETLWTQFEYTNTMISYLISFFVLVLASVLLHQLIILEQAVWYTLPTMLLYESGSEMYKNPDIAVNDIKPLRHTFEEYKSFLLKETNGNLDMITRLILLDFTDTTKIQMILPKELFEKSFNIEIVSLDGSTILSITNPNKELTYDFYGPNNENKDGTLISSIVAYLYLNIRLKPFSKSAYEEVQKITEDIQFIPNNPSLYNDAILRKLYPNILENPNFHIRERSNFPTLEYFQGFSNIKALQIKDVPPFWSNFSDIGIENGEFQTTFYYRLAPLLNNIQKRFQKSNIENQSKKGWFSFSDYLYDENNSLKNQIDKTILYWFYKYPLANNTRVFLTSTDNDGNKLNGAATYSFSFDNKKIQLSSHGFWSISVYDSSNRQIASVNSHYSSSESKEIVLAHENADVLTPKGAFYIVLKLVNVKTINITSSDVPLLYPIENYNYTFNLSVVSQFKNEGSILKEWLDHYLSEGVSHFYLINEDSTDNYMEILEPYIKKGIVTLKESIGRHKQAENYNQYLDECKKMSKWVIVCDLDEFLYNTEQNATIVDFLHSVPNNIGQVYIPWKMFGSSGHIEQPTNVVSNFKKRTNYDKNNGQGIKIVNGIWKGFCKTIVRTKALRSFWIHYSFLDGEWREICSDHSDIDKEEPAFQKITEQILKASTLHLNHYAIQSLNWFKEVKMTRGSVQSKKNDKIRDLKYFQDYDRDSNEVYDDSLAKKKNSEKGK